MPWQAPQAAALPWPASASPARVAAATSTGEAGCAADAAAVGVAAAWWSLAAGEGVLLVTAGASAEVLCLAPSAVAGARVAGLASCATTTLADSAKTRAITP